MTWPFHLLHVGIVAAVFVTSALATPSPKVERVYLVRESPKTPWRLATSLAVEANGNLFVGTSQPSGSFITKYNSTGDVLWRAKTATGSLSCQSLAIVNNRIVFAGLVETGGATIGTTFYSSRQTVFGILNVNGTFVYATVAPNLFDPQVASNGTDIYLAGNFSGTFRFDNVELTASGGNTAFLKTDANLKPIWARRGIPSGSSSGLSAIYNKGVLFSVAFQGDAFGIAGANVTGAPEPQQHSIAFFELSATGTATRAGSVVVGDIPWPVVPHTAAASAPDGSIVWVGEFGGTVQWGQRVFEAVETDAFAAKISPSGASEWFRKFTGPGAQSTYLTCVSPSGIVYVAGVFSSSITVGSQILQSFGGTDIFLAKLSPTGLPIWVKQFGFVGYDYPRGLALTPSGSVVLVGDVEAHARFDDIFLETDGLSEVFVLQLESETTSIPTIIGEPKPALIASGGTATFSVEVESNVPVNYQWFFNGRPLSDATNEVLQLTSVSADSAGEYYVVVQTTAGISQSATVPLRVEEPNKVNVSTISGTNSPGYVDSPDPARVRWNQPNGLEYVGSGYVAVADSHNHVIRLLDQTGAATTLAGAPEPGGVDGTGSEARFNFPLSVAVGPARDVLVADTENNKIRRLNLFGLRTVTHVAGRGPGLKDGPANEALLNYPNDLVADANGNIFVTEFSNHVVRKISAAGVVSTFAGSGVPGFRDGVSAALFNMPAGIEIDPNGNLYVTEWRNHTVRKITPAGLVTTLAGTNTPGFANGNGIAARFNTPDGITIDPAGNLYVTERLNHSVRRISPQGMVTTIAGLGAPGFINGYATVARFTAPAGILWHPEGTLWVSDAGNNAVRRIQLSNSDVTSTAELLITVNPVIEVFGQLGRTYLIEAAELGDVNSATVWRKLGSVTLTGESARWCDPQPASETRRIYRAIRSE